MRARPHHLVDIIAQYGAGIPFGPSDYGHAVHTVAARVKSDPEVQVELGSGADDICAPCKHLVNGRCDDVVGALDPPASKQDYNDALDRRVLAFLGLEEGACMTFTQYMSLLSENAEGLGELCAHPGEDPEVKGAQIVRGLELLRA